MAIRGAGAEKGFVELEGARGSVGWFEGLVGRGDCT